MVNEVLKEIEVDVATLQADVEKRRQEAAEYVAQCQRIFDELVKANEITGGEVAIKVSRPCTNILDNTTSEVEGLLLSSFGEGPNKERYYFFVSPVRIYALDLDYSPIEFRNEPSELRECVEQFVTMQSKEISVFADAIKRSKENAAPKKVHVDLKELGAIEVTS